jgi:uncharacterized protein
MELHSKNILITGANRGIGLALAQKAAQLGGHLHLLCRRKELELEPQLMELGASSVRCWTIDMSQPQDIDRFLKEFKTADIEPHILINNAGQLTGGLLEDQPMEDIYQMFQVNLLGLVHLTRGLLPMMLKCEQAKIVNNASVSGIMFLPCATTYAASKAGVVAFTESLRNELHGTSVSTLLLVTPGVKTRMYDKISDLYANNVDLSFMSSVSAEEWAAKVFDHIRRDRLRCWPSGTTFLGVKMGQHWPNLLAKVVRPYFKRET